MSDIRGFSDILIEFELGKPFFPFEQLLAVLPPASKALLPKAFQVSQAMDIAHESYTVNNYNVDEYDRV